LNSFFFLKISPGGDRTIDVRLRTFDNILQLLNIATQLGIGPKLNDLVAKNETEPLSINVEENILPSPIQPLGALKKLKTKSVAVQTSISNRVKIQFYSFKCIILFSSRIQLHIVYKGLHQH
jgi:hypothetical protein